MARFPKLKTGAAAQYPAARRTAYATEAVRYADGSEQRFRDFAAPRRTWDLDLTLLTPTEAAEIREFFVEMRGASGVFEFEDPWTGTVAANCRFGEDVLIERVEAEYSEATRLTVVEV